MPNTVIYFPSLSCGNSKGWLVNNAKIHPDLTSRFYDKSVPESIYHPYFLVSAGHNFKDADIRNKMGLNDSFVMGDSGGHQIATGALEWNLGIREQIFHWLEANSDIAINIDIPTRGVFAGKFEEALAISKDNFKYFNEHQSGKTKFLNVLQGLGVSFEYGKRWYNEVKDFEFHGWAFGGVRQIDKIMLSIAYLLEQNELDKSHVKYLHYLAATTPQHFIVLALIQNALNQKYGDKIQISTDSSSPNLSSVYGNYYVAPNWKSMTFNGITIGKKHNLNLDAPLPCGINCPVCKGLTFKDLSNFDEYQYMILTHHNMAMFTHTVNFANKIVLAHDVLLQEFLSRDLYLLRQSLYEMIESPNPMAIYSKYINTYKNLSGADIEIIDDEKINDFFSIVPPEQLKKKKSKDKNIIIDSPCCDSQSEITQFIDFE